MMRLPFAILMVCVSTWSLVGFADDFSLAFDDFQTALDAARKADQNTIRRLEKIEKINQDIIVQEGKVDDLRTQLDQKRNEPIPPDPFMNPFMNQMGQNGGGNGGGGNGGGGSGSGNGPQAPQMGDIPQTPAFTPPTPPTEASLDLGKGMADLGGSNGSYTGGNSSLPGFKAPTSTSTDSSDGSDASSTPNPYNPAQVASQGAPKLKTLDPLPPPRTVSDSGLNGAAQAGKSGYPMGPVSSASAGAGASAGNDGSTFNVGAEAPPEGPSGISTKVAGWGEGGGEGDSETSSGGYGNEAGSSSEERSSKGISNQLLSNRPGLSASRYIRTKPDGSVNDTIFGKVSFWLDDKCGFLADSKNSSKPSDKLGLCDKAVRNEVAMLSEEGSSGTDFDFDSPEGVVRTQQSSKRQTRNIASNSDTENDSVALEVAYGAPKQAPSVPVTKSSPKSQSERAQPKSKQDNLLDTVRAAIW